MIAQLEIENVDETIDTVFLEADQKGTAANEFEAKLSSRIVGQERAVRQTSDLYQVFLAGMNPPNQPVGTMLFLGRQDPAKRASLKPLPRFSSATLMQLSRLTAPSFSTRTR